ncbi:MAG TPA: hypothetical protein VKU87_06115 [Thermomicrobiaceae bacterium]|nr:hypothetical protein [Thermomicrobiaceae bacterium]
MGERETNYLSAEAEAALKCVSTATLTSQLLKRGFRNTFLGGLMPVRPELRMVGYAFTMRYIPMREDLDLVPEDNFTNLQRVAVESVGPKDVLVIDARGDLDAGTLGNILATRMQVRGAAGIVSDGGMRDAFEFADIELATYIGGVHAGRRGTRHHPADLNVPIGCAGVLVMPGDVMVGDPDGVVAIPRHVAEEVAHDALEQELLEAYLLKLIQGGSSIHGVYPPDEATLNAYRQAARNVSSS